MLYLCSSSFIPPLTFHPLLPSFISSSPLSFSPSLPSPSSSHRFQVPVEVEGSDSGLLQLMECFPSTSVNRTRKSQKRLHLKRLCLCMLGIKGLTWKWEEEALAKCALYQVVQRLFLLNGTLQGEYLRLSTLKHFQHSRCQHKSCDCYSIQGCSIHLGAGPALDAVKPHPSLIK